MNNTLFSALLSHHVSYPKKQFESQIDYMGIVPTDLKVLSQYN